MNEQILVTSSSMPNFDEYCDVIKKIWVSHWLTNMGIEYQTLQKELEKCLACPHVILYTKWAPCFGKCNCCYAVLCSQ